ncbi:MAG: Uncharacterized protein Athens071416_235 [Parcubacteria group bacterium Athens0714_16]|nr:MAG: Uncharacterized protein Athens071416_235 [Parcubacteria group bacterium Athens0714_16]
MFLKINNPSSGAKLTTGQENNLKFHHRMKKIIPIISTIFVFLLNFDSAFAAISYQPLSPLPGTTVTVNNEQSVTSLGGYITGLYKIVIGVAIILAVLSFIMAGLEWMTSEAVGKKEDAIKKINAALFGLLLTFGSWLFLNTINPATVSFNLDMKKVSIIDTEAPIVGGYFCQLVEGGPYYGPYATEESCVSKTECNSTSVPGSGGRYCLKIAKTPPTGGTGGATGIGVGDEVLIEPKDKFFDTGIREESGDFTILPGPGLYFNVYLYSYNSEKNISTPRGKKKMGPYKTAQECNTAKDKFGTAGLEEKANGECFLVDWGSNDYVLNKALLDEKTNDLRNKISVPINSLGCRYVGQGCPKIENGKCEGSPAGGCTNVGGLDYTVISAINTLKKSCDAWVKNPVNINPPATDCPITLTGGTEWWFHGDRFLDVMKNMETTEHIPTTTGNTSKGRDIDISSGDTKTIFTQYILKHTDKICSKGADGKIKDIKDEKTLDPTKKLTNLEYWQNLGLGKEFNPGNMVKFCLNSPYAMFRFETNPNHWHVRFGTCGCN